MTADKEKMLDVYDAIGRMTAACAKEGIAKDRQNTDQKYKFRGIDDVRNLIAPLQDECKLVIFPHLVERVEKERTTKSGGFALQVVVKIDFHLVSRVDGSEIVIRMENEAIDYSDKATNKAISQAYKAFCINTFNIPTEGEDDTDKEKVELKARKVGVFDSPDLRKTYADNCVTAFGNADSALKLKEIEGFYHEKLILMANSEDEIDRSEATRCRECYATRLQTLSTPPRRTTVDSVVKGAA